MVRIHNVPPNPSFPHAFSGNPGEVRMDPRLKHSGVTAFGSRISLPSSHFQGSARRSRRIAKFSYFSFLLRALRDLLKISQNLFRAVKAGAGNCVIPAWRAGIHVDMDVSEASPANLDAGLCPSRSTSDFPKPGTVKRRADITTLSFIFVCELCKPAPNAARFESTL